MINLNPRTVALELWLGACALCEGLHEVFGREGQYSPQVQYTQVRGGLWWTGISYQL